jgi:hypothetical protein
MPCRFQWQPGNASLAWSPAGTQLALLDPDSGLITIWGGSALPK